MKTFLTIILALVIFVSNAQENNFKLICDFSNIKVDMVYMLTMGEKGMITIATAPVIEGKFTIEGKLDWENYYYFLSDTNQAKMKESFLGQLYVEKGTTKLTGEFGHFPLFKIEGGKYLDSIYAYQSNPKYLELREKINSYDDRELNDEEKISLQKIQMEIYPMTGNVNYKWWPESHPKHQIHKADQYYHDKDFENFNKQANHIIETYPTHPDASRMKVVKSILEEREQKGELSETGRVGTEFDNVILKDKDGKEYNLSGIVKKNKLVLLDFWASWCGPCRSEFPHLRMAYKHYNEKGFEIFAVSLDEKNEAWLKAMGEEKTSWINVVDPNTWQSEYTKAYNIRGIPYNVLINTEGEIIGENLRGEGLVEMLKKVLD